MDNQENIYGRTSTTDLDSAMFRFMLFYNPLLFESDSSRVCCTVHRAIYGLKEAPSLWQDEHTSEMTKVRIKAQGEDVRVNVGQVRQSLCMIAKRDSLQEIAVSNLGIDK